MFKVLTQPELGELDPEKKADAHSSLVYTSHKPLRVLIYSIARGAESRESRLKQFQDWADVLNSDAGLSQKKAELRGIRFAWGSADEACAREKRRLERLDFFRADFGRMDIGERRGSHGTGVDGYW